jgi:DNA-binding MarR family transcriptional regulator
MVEQNIKTETAKVKEALERLVAEGLVVKLQGMDSRSRYRISPGMRKKTAKLLKETEEDG